MRRGRSPRPDTIREHVIRAVMPALFCFLLATPVVIMVYCVWKIMCITGKIVNG